MQGVGEVSIEEKADIVITSPGVSKDTNLYRTKALSVAELN